MSRDDIAAIVAALADLAQLVCEADPAHEADIYAQLNLTLTYQPGPTPTAYHRDRPAGGGLGSQVLVARNRPFWRASETGEGVIKSVRACCFRAAVVRPLSRAGARCGDEAARAKW